MRSGIALLAALAAMSVVACTGDRVTAPTAPSDPLMVGRYQLQSINGLGLPFGLIQAARSIDVLSGSVELHMDKTFYDILRYRLRGSTTAAIVTDTVRGTFIYIIDELAFQPSDGRDMYFLNVTDGHTLQSTETGVLIMYRRP
ncbi:MAG TPA: hypothetical protein VGM50_15875 [Gemmatimonadaceae bacterium]